MTELELLLRQLTSTRARRVGSSRCYLEKNDTIGGFQIMSPLGKGRFATVWSARRQADESVVAIKVYRSGDDNTAYYRNEVKVLNRLLEFSISTQTIPPNIIGYLGTFAHVAIGEDKVPSIHPCVLFNMEGDTLSKLLKVCKRQYTTGIPLHIVKKIMRELLTGLAYLHQCNIIHTDIKPSNILLNKRVEDLDEAGLTVSLADLGSATTADDIFSSRVGTTYYIAPELIAELPYSMPIDIWAAFTVCYELITGDLLFDVYAECDVTYGEDVDDEGLDGIAPDCEVPAVDDMVCDDGYAECKTCTDNSKEGSSAENTSRSFSFSDSSGSTDGMDDERVNYRHLLLIAKVIGYPPNEFARYARSYYNRRDRLKNNPDISPMTICELLFSNYDMDRDDCQKIEEFLLCGLRYLPEDRITAEQALGHPFLQ